MYVLSSHCDVKHLSILWRWVFFNVITIHASQWMKIWLKQGFEFTMFTSTLKGLASELLNKF